MLGAGLGGGEGEVGPAEAAVGPLLREELRDERERSSAGERPAGGSAASASTHRPERSPLKFQKRRRVSSVTSARTKSSVYAGTPVDVRRRAVRSMRRARSPAGRVPGVGRRRRGGRARPRPSARRRGPPSRSRAGPGTCVVASRSSSSSSVEPLTRRRPTELLSRPAVVVRVPAQSAPQIMAMKGRCKRCKEKRARSHVATPALHPLPGACATLRLPGSALTHPRSTPGGRGEPGRRTRCGGGSGSGSRVPACSGCSCASAPSRRRSTRPTLPSSSGSR